MGKLILIHLLLVIITSVFLIGGVAGVAVEQANVSLKVIGDPTSCVNCGDDSRDAVDEKVLVSSSNPFAIELLGLINDLRASLGVTPLTFNPNIDLAALLHSNDMLAQGYFDHISLDARLPWDRMNDAGFFGYAYGENIAAHTGLPDAAYCYDLWYNSPGHYANMIDPDFNLAGIGIASGNWGYPGWDNAYSTIYTLNLGGADVGCSEGETRQCGLGDAGQCEYGIETCTGGYWGVCVGAVYPITEICDNLLDDDCDGDVDEFCDCDPQDYFSCYGGDVYWYNSCGWREDKKEDCVYGCLDGSCVVCEEHADSTCYSDDVFWYNSCGWREDRKEDCLEGCSGGECISCEDHDFYWCYGGDVYWYDSCGKKQERKEDCGYGCSFGECSPAPCDDEDDDGFDSVNCGGDDCDDTNPQAYPGSVEICNGLDENCNDVVDEGCEDNLIINSPGDGDLFDSRRVKIDLDILHLDGRVYYTDNDGRTRTFCSRLDRGGEGCEKNLYLTDGLHELDFWLFDFNGDKSEASIEVFVDSKDPKIRRTEPRKYANGEFEVKFREVNTEHVTLHYGDREYDVRSESCYLDRYDYVCDFFVDISEYNGEEIYYWFEVEDIIGNVDESRLVEVVVDTVDPFVDEFDVEIDRRRATFIFNIDEDNFDKIEYLDHSDRTPRWRRLCTRLREGICEKSKSFREGFHELDFRVLDKAGNFVEISNDLLI